MTSLKSLGLAAAFAAVFMTDAALAVAKVGQPAPDFSVADSKGKTESLSAYKGKTVVLEWTNNGCPFVKKHYGSGNMQSLQKAATADGVVWLTLISSAPGKQGHVSGAEADRLTSERKALPTAVLLDEKGEVGRLYDAQTTPHMFIVDAKGTLVYAGGIDDTPSPDPEDIPKSKNYVQLALAEIKAGRPVTDAVTKPYGCSIKY
jgi:hypothetical protein